MTISKEMVFYCLEEMENHNKKGGIVSYHISKESYNDLLITADKMELNGDPDHITIRTFCKLVKPSELMEPGIVFKMFHAAMEILMGLYLH